jgi:Probable sensor domain DACNV
MGSRSSQPSDLAQVVFHELQRRYDESSEGDAACPSLEVLTNLFEAMYFASMDTEEGEPIRFHVVYLDPDTADARLAALPPGHRWTHVRFGELIPATIPNLVKLAMASDPRTSSLALYHDADGHLCVWGLVDQGNRYYDYITHAADRSYERPGLFQANIIGIGRVSADIGYERIAVLWIDTLRSVPHDVLAEGPIRDSLQPGIRSFIDAVHGGLPDGVYEWRPEVDASLTGEWLSSLSRLLLGVQHLFHGGAVLITPDASRRGLDIKYEIEYPRLRSALRETALFRIREAHARERIAEKLFEKG